MVSASCIRCFGATKRNAIGGNVGDDIKKWTDDEIVGLLHGDMEKAKSIQGELATQREE